MSKAKKFIEDYTRNCSNELSILEAGCLHQYAAWLTPEQARRAVEIEREELIEKACEWLSNVSIEDMTYKYDNFDTSEGWYKFIDDFKKYMKEE